MNAQREPDILRRIRRIRWIRRIPQACWACKARIALALASALLFTCSSAALASAQEGFAIDNLGQTGFEQTNPEYTSLATVILYSVFNSSATGCRYSNDNESWSLWKDCLYTFYWKLNETQGLQTVYAEFNHTDGAIARFSDTIHFNRTGGGLDTTPPVGLSVVDDGAYTNDNTSLRAYWWNATDPESGVLKIPFQYRYRIRDTSGVIVGWTDAGAATAVTRTNLSLSDSETYYIDVVVTNSAELSANASSDGIRLDRGAPVMTDVDSVSHPVPTSWYADTSPTMTFSALDAISNVSGFSYVMDSSNSTVPGNVSKTSAGNATVWGLTDGICWFHVKPHDEAMNWGAPLHRQVRVDATPPPMPVLTLKRYNSTTGELALNWTAVSDISLPITYEVNLTDLATDVSQAFVGIAVAGTVLSVAASTDYLVEVRARNAAGLASVRGTGGNATVDTIAPRFVAVSPGGLVPVGSFTLAVITDENASCTYDGTPFVHTDDTYHEARLARADGAYLYAIRCTDPTGNVNQTTASFTVDTTQSVASVSVSAPSLFYAGRINSFSLRAENAGGIGLSGLSSASSSLSLSFNGTRVADVSLLDHTDGDYTVSFLAPKRGGYVMDIRFAGIAQNYSVSVRSVLLTLRYSDPLLPSLAPSMQGRLAYTAQPGFSFGLASDSRYVIAGGDDASLNLSSDATSGNAYLFLTIPGPRIADKQEYLARGDLLDQMNPSFGYLIASVNRIWLQLDYRTIWMEGDSFIPPGKHAIRIMNTGYVGGRRAVSFEVDDGLRAEEDLYYTLG
ncbi:hypothetical protein JXB02_04980 [Candidatus Woesearchaeota archaeon]|nr:hypothetical protein [Candidatus Woesearchaeota archaeon]